MCFVFFGVILQCVRLCMCFFSLVRCVENFENIVNFRELIFVCF